MKTIVVNDKDQTKIPFLRGILVRSLLDAGLEFDDAHSLATELREELADTEEISASEVRERISALLESRGHLGAVDPYGLPLTSTMRIEVNSRKGNKSAFSRSRHERFLQASGMKAEKAEQVTDAIYERLLVDGVTTVTTRQLGYVTYLFLRQEVSKKMARRFLTWSEYRQSSRSLMLLICGAVGSGKSTVATEVAHVLDIVRIQSTDMLREVMRMMIPDRLLPMLHASSFDAWKALPIRDARERDPDQLVADGFRSQSDLLAVACEAVLQRAFEESVPVILEGVHAHPELLERLPDDPKPIAVHTTLAVLKAKELKSRLKGRGKEVPARRAKRYLNKFDAIWSLQSFLLSEADRYDAAIITNHDKEKAVQQVILQVIVELSKHFDSSPREVFGAVVDRVGGEAEDDSWQQAVTRLAPE
jgi:2-phosphoglycerate kinase